MLRWILLRWGLVVAVAACLLILAASRPLLPGARSREEARIERERARQEREGREAFAARARAEAREIEARLEIEAQAALADEKPAAGAGEAAPAGEVAATRPGGAEPAPAEPAPAEPAPAEPAPADLEGRLTQPDLRPVEGIEVRLHVWRSGALVASTYTDSTGAFQFPGQAPGGYRLEYGPSGKAVGAADGKVELAPGGNRLELRAPRLGGLRLELRDAEARPVAGAEFKLIGRFGLDFGGTTGETGVLEFRHLPVGTYDLHRLGAAGEVRERDRVEVFARVTAQRVLEL